MTKNGGGGGSSSNSAGGCVSGFVLLAAAAGIVSTNAVVTDPESAEPTTIASRLFSEVFSITTILLRDCREAGLVFCRRIVVDFRQRGAQEIRLPYNKVMKLQSEGLTGGGYDSYYYKVSQSL